MIGNKFGHGIGLRQPTRTNRSKRQVSRTATFPAPTGGWNAQDALPDMEPDDAVLLDNIIPGAGSCSIRRGNRLHSAGTATSSILVYRGTTSGTDSQFAVSAGNVYDSTTYGAGFGVAVYTGLSNDRVQYVNFSNDAGRWMWCCNGGGGAGDAPFTYSGSAWAALVITGSSGSITLDPKDLIDVMVHKRRLFTVEAGTMHVWYGATDAISGAFSLLDLGPYLSEGGEIICQGAWSLDGGQGQDDYAVWVTSEGQAIVYQGTDPSDTNNWAQVGVFDIGRPLGRRALINFGSDLIVLTTLGAIPLSQALRFDRAQENLVAVTAKIQNAFAEVASAYSANFGWEGITYPFGTLAIYNVPTAQLGTAQQFVQNLQTGGWCRFTGLNAYCWAMVDGMPFFGTSDGVHRWDIGVTDAGTDLVCDMTTAFNDLGRSGVQKHITMVQPVFRASETIMPAIGILTDFAETAPTNVPLTTVTGPAGTIAIRQLWSSADAIGVYAAVRMRIRLTIDPDLEATLVTGDGFDVSIDGSDTIITAPDEPVNDAVLEAISFNVVYEVGAAL